MALTREYTPRHDGGFAEQCPHCSSGWVYEPTEDALEDEAHECWMCLGTGRKMHRSERIRARADLDAHYTGLERMEG
jgi:hypothetical protein